LSVVAIAEAGVRETVVDDFNGLLVKSCPEEVAVGIDRLLKDPALAGRLGPDGPAWVERNGLLIRLYRGSTADYGR
jgi:glycosyltransferase involved in cell wall biosynthesis